MEKQPNKKTSISGKQNIRFDKLLETPSQYMMGKIGDLEFDQFIIENMKQYINAKLKFEKMTRL